LQGNASAKNASTFIHVVEPLAEIGLKLALQDGYKRVLILSLNIISTGNQNLMVTSEIREL